MRQSNRSKTGAAVNGGGCLALMSALVYMLFAGAHWGALLVAGLAIGIVAVPVVAVSEGVFEALFGLFEALFAGVMAVIDVILTALSAMLGWCGL